MYNTNSLPYLNKKGRILALDNMRAIAIVMVICIHALSYCLPLPDLQFNIVRFIVYPIAVPVFFLVDGLLFAKRMSISRVHYSQYIRKSILRLVVPWIIFTTLYTVIRFFFESIGFVQNKLIYGEPFSDTLILSYASFIAPQMYFLLSLFCIRVVYPVTSFLFIKQKYYISCSFFSILVILYYTFGVDWLFPFNILAKIHGQEPVIHAVWGINFYILGIILFRTQTIIDGKKIIFPALAIFTISLFIRLNTQYNISVIIQYSYIICFYYSISYLKITNKLLNMIGKNTMGIYLLHAPIIISTTSIIIKRLTSTPLLSFTLIVIFSLLLSIICVHILKKVKFGKIILGEQETLLTSVNYDSPK